MALSTPDLIITEFDRVLKIVTGTLRSSERPSPAASLDIPVLAEDDRALSARLMRVNHTGEVCAQALYQGQALTSRNQPIAKVMQQAAAEETDHLVWCETRLKELNSHTSYLNPFYYLGSFGIGAVAGALGDKTNFGFVAETERQVVEHLEQHLLALPDSDSRSRAILEAMRRDERGHAHRAVQSGGRILPTPIRKMMRSIANVMKRTTYWI